MTNIDVLGIIVTWGAFVAACAAHALYHFKAASKIDWPQSKKWQGPR